MSAYEKMATTYIFITSVFLSLLYFAVYRSKLQIYSHLQPIYGGSGNETWNNQRRMDGN
jgi:hypothetical protein